MTNLVKEAIGFDATRGDSVSVTGADFLKPSEPEPLPEPPIWKQDWVFNVLKQVLGGAFALFHLFRRDSSGCEIITCQTLARIRCKCSCAGRYRWCIGGAAGWQQHSRYGRPADRGTDRRRCPTTAFATGHERRRASQTVRVARSQGRGAGRQRLGGRMKNSCIEENNVAEESRGIDGAQKAAIFLMAVGEGPAAEVMKHLGPREVQKIGVAMSGLEVVSPQNVKSALGEFVQSVKTPHRNRDWLGRLHPQGIGRCAGRREKQAT